MYCPYCGAETQPDYAFCRSCGKGLPGVGGEQTPRGAVPGSPGASPAPTSSSPGHSPLRLALFIAVPIVILAAAGVGAYLGLRGTGSDREGQALHVESTDTVTTTATSLVQSTSTASSSSSSLASTTSGVQTTAPAQQTTSSHKTTTTGVTTTTEALIIGQLQTELTLELANQVTRYEDTDPLLKWSGTWDTIPLPDASGGTYHVSWGDAAVLIRFQGTSISLFAQMFFSHGIAKLTLDSDVYLVDMYSENAIGSKTVWSSPALAYGIHYLTIATTGTKNPESFNTFINVDALDVAGELLE